MAKIDAGIIRAVSGKLGNVVAMNRGNETFLRMKAVKVNNPQTEAQLAQRARFGMVMQFVRPLTGVIKIGLKNNPLGKTAYGYLISSVLQKAVTGEYPNQVIDYAAVQISEGGLLQVSDVKAEIKEGALEFSWVYEANDDFTGWSAEDQVILVVYNVTKRQVGSSMGKFQRDAQVGSISLPAQFAGDTLLAYLALMSADGTTVSTSQFAGSFVMNGRQ